PPPVQTPPTVTIISPNQSIVNYQGNNCTINIVAKVTGVTNQSEISVLYNGNPFPNYTWNANAGQVTITMQNVNSGAHVFVISAQTTAGSASQSVTFNCSPPPPPPQACQPVITVISPNQSTVTYQGNNCNLNVVAKITCITDPGQISVKWNGNPFTAYTWNPSSQHIHWNMQHVSPSNNVFVITATNSAGTASVTQTFICNSSPNNTTNQKPAITLVTPATDPYTSTVNTMTVVLKIEFISGAGDVQFKLNNQIQSGGTYNASTMQYSIPVTLNSGNNSIQVKASNGQGQTTKNMTITLGGGKTNENNKNEEKGGDKKPPVPNAPKPKTGTIKKDG
ncbi:MAG: hypothetical protein IT242_07715, partial [Bacteroidia bacterium]|nr:hypothetical protein [Bacteroidia bacterium]